MTTRPTVEGVSEETMLTAIRTGCILNEQTLQTIIDSPKFRDYEKQMARELLAARQQLAELHDKDYALSEAEAALVTARQQLAEMRGASHADRREAISGCNCDTCCALREYACLLAELGQKPDAFAYRPIGAALAPTSQPSRGKLSLSEAVEAARGHADPVRDLSAMRGDCAQPERQGQQTTRAPLFIEGVSDPSPPQDDIVAGLRDCLIRSKPEGDEAIVPIKLWERAIAALGEKGWIPVGERMPEDCHHVLMRFDDSYSGSYQIGWCEGEKWYANDADSSEWHDVTHWHELPAPPVAGGL